MASQVISDSEIRDAALSLDDARLAIARYHDFLDWSSLAAHVAAVSQEGAVFEFESAVEAVVNGDPAALEDALRRDPAPRPRPFNPRLLLRPAGAPRHAGPLRRRQRRRSIPPEDAPNAVEIARALLEAGAEPDAVADMHGAACTTMSVLVSSSHPSEAGLQVPLVEFAAGFRRCDRRTRHQEMGRAALHRANLRDKRCR
jgi:hypothetical protein